MTSPPKHDSLIISFNKEFIVALLCSRAILGVMEEDKKSKREDFCLHGDCLLLGRYH